MGEIVLLTMAKFKVQPTLSEVRLKLCPVEMLWVMMVVVDGGWWAIVHSV